MISLGCGCNSEELPHLKILQSTSQLGNISCNFTPIYWKRLFRHAQEHAVLQRHSQYVVAAVHLRIAQCLVEQAHLSEDVLRPTVSIEPTKTVFGCMHCQKALASKGGEGAHMFKHRF